MNEKYAPIQMNVQAEIEEALHDPAFKSAWDALEEE